MVDLNALGGSVHGTLNGLRKRHAPKLSVVIAGVVALMLIACDDLTSEDYVERARNYREQGDIQASIIELKNAVQADRQNAEARLLLGKSYLKIGDLESAEKEFIWARDLGIDPTTAIRTLATVWLMQRKSERILEEFVIDDETPPGERVISHLARAIAHFYLDDLASAEEQYRRALEIDSESLQALVGMASVALEQGRLADAQSALTSAYSLSDDDVSVLALIGDLSTRQGDLEAAETAYRSLLRGRPNNTAARLALARIELALGKVDLALENIEQILQGLPRHPGANFLRAAVAVKAGDFDTAKRHSEQILQANPEHRESLLIAGAASLARDELEQAHRYLSAFVIQVPGHVIGSRLLAEAQGRLARRQRYPPEVTQLLDGSADDRLLVVANDPDIEWQQSLNIGRALWATLEGEAGQVLEEPPCVTSAGLDTFLKRLEDGTQPLPWLVGLQDNKCAANARRSLEHGREQEPYSFVRQLLLAQLDLRERRLRTALRAVETLLLEPPERASLLVIKGLAELGLDRLALARSTFRRLQEAVPTSADARVLLASTYRREDERETLKGQLEDALAIEPDHLPARVALVRLAVGTGDLAYAETQMGALTRSDPGNPSVLELQGLLALARGDHVGAVANLERALDIEPNGVRALKLAIVHDRIGNGADAIAVLDRWLTSHPTDVDVRLALANRYLSSGRVEDARSHYHKVRLVAPNNFVALNNLAWTELLLGNPKVALLPAQQAYRLAPDDPRVLDTYGYALAEAGDLDKAVELLRRAVKRAPQDAQAQYHLAHALTKRGDREEAKGILERILAEPAAFPGREGAKELLQALQG